MGTIITGDMMEQTETLSPEEETSKSEDKKDEKKEADSKPE